MDHGWDMPIGAREGLEEILKEEKDANEKESATMGVEPTGPFISKILGVKDCKSRNIHTLYFNEYPDDYGTDLELHRYFTVPTPP